jgi:hypothetical protein
MQNSTSLSASQLPIFLSVVIVVRNQAPALPALLQHASNVVSNIAQDYELIVVDNASDDASVDVLKGLTAESGLPNLQVFALTKNVDDDTASWAGMENALGDFVAVVNPITDDIEFIREMTEHAVRGSDVVFAENTEKSGQTIPYKVCFAAFNMLYMWFNGVRLGVEAPQYRVLSKRVINFILQHPLPAIAYRHLPATAGFSRKNLKYSSASTVRQTEKRLLESIDRGMRLLVSTTRAPMRLVTTLSIFGALSNLIYSFYVIVIGLVKTDVAPGWITLSLQQSGMFFLLSLVLLVLGEYILHMASLANEGPLYHVAQEFNSAIITRRKKLNIEEVKQDLPKEAVTDIGQKA